MPKSQLTPCLMCGDMPCTCPTGPSGKSRATTTPSKTKSSSSSGSVNKFAGLMSSSSPAPSSIDYSVPPKPATTRPVFDALIESEEVLDAETLELKACLEVLWPILSPSVRNEYRELMQPTLRGDLFRRRGEVLRSLRERE